MRILVTGSTGYIGLAVASALRRSGHEVWGLCRDEKKEAALQRHEIHPLRGDMNQPETYAEALGECAVLVHAAFDMRGGVTGQEKTLLGAFDAAARKRPGKSLIYTSGVWVLGNSGERMLDETAPPHPLKIVGWRVAQEETVLRSGPYRGVVIRPGCVYGKSGGLTRGWFVARPEVVGDGANRWAMVHVDDLADLYRRAVESGVSGEVFHGVDASRSTVAEMASAASRAAGGAGEITRLPVAEAAKTMGDFAEALAVDQWVDASKAGRLLGWAPRHHGFLEDVAAFCRAARAGA